MCYEKRDEEFARVCQERDELKRICVKQAEMNGRIAAMALELDDVKSERDALKAADVVPVYIVSGNKLPPNPNGALTLSTEYIGKHENGWEIVADVQENYYEWVNKFVAYRHEYPTAFVAGDFEEVVIASSKKDYEEFLSLFPPDAWDYGDI